MYPSPDVPPTPRGQSESLCKGGYKGGLQGCKQKFRLQIGYPNTADAAAARFWREAGSPSALAARALYISIYRRRWGCEAALQGARLRLARSYLVGSQAQAGGAAFGDSADAFGAGFDPSREADVAAAGAPTLGGVPAGQRG